MEWDRATLALSLLAVDPAGLGGMIVRARSGPARDKFLSNLGCLPQPQQRLHPAMTQEALFGGVDLTETLTQGKVALSEGLIARAASAILTMSDRADVGFAAQLAQAMDRGELQTLICLDEGADAEEMTPSALADRLAFRVELDVPRREAVSKPDETAIRDAQVRLPSVDVTDDVVSSIVALCHHFGIVSQRAALFATRAARAAAAIAGREQITQSDIETAAALVLAHRATQLPQTEEDAPPPPPETEPETKGAEDIGQLDDQVIAAVLAHLPAGLLDQLQMHKGTGTGSGAGAKKRGNRRGRPKPARMGHFGGNNRLDLVATLRTAAPWQALRPGSENRIRIWPSDFRIKQFEDRSDRLLIFAVDASGSAAIARLAEAKGAVELLLAEAYSKRDYVSLISFRGTEAETLLPPTRSLVQTKRRLAALPGGGGTPLAAGLLEAWKLADKARRQGLTPTVIVLTDGRANIALSGDADRTAAKADSETIAAQIRCTHVDCIVLDVGKRPSSNLVDLARVMGGNYLSLPRADAFKLSEAVSTSLQG